MKSADAIAAAETRAEQAERRALAAQIQLDITRARLVELDKSAAEVKDAQAMFAVRKLVSSGAIKPGDVFTMHEMKMKFLADADLIPLATGKFLTKESEQPNESTRQLRHWNP